MASEDKQVAQPTGDGGGGGGRAGAGSTLQPLHPAVPIRGIRMKFAVLAGLVEVGEVSNRDIVETVFNLVSLQVKGRTPATFTLKYFTFLPYLFVCFFFQFFTHP